MRLMVVWAPISGWRELVGQLFGIVQLRLKSETQVDSTARFPAFHEGYPCEMDQMLNGQKVQVLFYLHHGSSICGQRYLHTGLILVASAGQSGN